MLPPLSDKSEGCRKGPQEVASTGYNLEHTGSNSAQEIGG
jgi:hypothetical protein